MPVTMKLSREFYDRLGERVAGELVGMFDVVETNFRAELRDINALAVTSFDLKLEQRLGEFRVVMDLRFAEVDARFTGLEKSVDARFVALERSIDRRFDEVDAKFHNLELTMRRDQQRLIMWMVGLWVSSTVGIIGVMLQLIPR